MSLAIGLILCNLIIFDIILGFDMNSFNWKVREISSVVEKLPFNQKMLYRTEISESSRKLQLNINEINELFRDSVRMSDTTKLLKGLILMKAGALDESHEIIQLLSSHDAYYAHSLLHRLEGSNVGELGLTGWSNCGYWQGQYDYHPNFPQLYDYAYSLYQSQSQYNSCNKISELFTEYFRAIEWDCNRFLTFCIDVNRCKDSTALEYCEKITSKECDLLIENNLNQLN
jgi:hypothetical protein